jgi:hypothetical protein
VSVKHAPRRQLKKYKIKRDFGLTPPVDSLTLRRRCPGQQPQGSARVKVARKRASKGKRQGKFAASKIDGRGLTNCQVSSNLSDPLGGASG